MTTNNAPPGEASETALEAARYALTRRIAPVLRHHMVVHLQPIGMIYEVLDRKLAAASPHLPAVRDGLAKIKHLARSAVTSCLDVVTWISPDPIAVIGLGAGVAECTELLRSSLMFRGFTLENRVGGSVLQVSQTALREVLTSALLATADAAEAPLELILSASTTSSAALISITARRASSGENKGSLFATDIAYRPLMWSDVACLAREHGVPMTIDPLSAQMAFAPVA